MSPGFISLVVICLSFCLVVSNGFNLNKNGGYDIVFAINEDTPSPPNAIIYWNKIQLISQMWSNAMWSITGNKFFINSIEIIVPEHWRLPSQPLTIQSYKTADFRLSDEFQYLRAENPNTCGLPGEFIELPSEFFNSAAWNGPFGTPWKALITQWARYRWGIWEEHGYPGDERYPYFYKKPGQPGWLTTGCSDIQLQGKYMTIENKTCDVNGEEYPGDDCRFFPYADAANNDATTSLMYFHWISSVENFCDETTHNHGSPNRQNKYCGHRSAWEVIRETPDFKHVTDPPPTFLPDLAFTNVIFKASLYPRLSVLIDNGHTSVPQEILDNVIGGQIGRLFTGGTINRDTVAKIWSFPSDRVEEGSTTLIKTEVEWSTVENNLPFITTLNNVTNDGPELRDFASALQAGIHDLSEKNNPAGSILIMVKTGSTAQNFGNIPYEHDLMIILQDNPRIRLYVIEILENEQSSAHLERLTRVSNGKHVQIRSLEDIETNLSPIIVEIIKMVTTIKDPEPEKNNFRGVFRGTLLPNHVNEISILTNNLDELEFHLTTIHEILIDQIYIRPLIIGHTNQTSVSLTSEWNESNDPSRRFTYSLKTTSQIQENSKWLIHYPCDSSNCDSILHIYGQINETSPKTKDDTESEVEILLSTSTKVSDSSSVSSTFPFIIFASVHKKGQPVIGLEITAMISKVGSNDTWNLTLIDDGHSSPDIALHDGIYSAHFNPGLDGDYKIVGWIKNSDCLNDDKEIGGKMVLPDQKNFGCFPTNKNMKDANLACTTHKLTGSFGRIVHVPGVFHVQNSAGLATGQPYRVMDLQGSPDNNSGLLTFTFTSPALIGSEDQGTSYTIYYSDNIRDLVGGLDSAKVFGSYVATGTPKSLEFIQDYPPNNALNYYAVETNYDRLRSGPSNIVAVMMTNSSCFKFSDLTNSSLICKNRSTEVNYTKVTNSNPSSSTTTRTITDKVMSSPLPNRDRVQESESVWAEPKVIAGVILGSVVLITALIFVTVHCSRRSMSTSTYVV